MQPTYEMELQVELTIEMSKLKVKIVVEISLIIGQIKIALRPDDIHTYETNLMTWLITYP